MNKYVEHVIQKRIDELEELRTHDSRPGILYYVRKSQSKEEKELQSFLDEYKGIQLENGITSVSEALYKASTMSGFEFSLDKITSDIVDLLVRKNANYGNSFDRQMDEYGMIAAVIRLDDKMSRLRALTKGEPDKVGESVDDTLRDIVGYTLLTLNWLANQSGEDPAE